ncbi:hypothetical protein [Rhabdochromatium marinum]|uniref:hypothetical protein n=1 Tax=Rhabdochromatium marinum TaxID=48729 RepID=UPI001904D4BA|nr:hypothetical protein [Rhabdochromatium marinum]MBK1648629.1 hypothetical protein [Rhabdochromatium marinum]
MLRTAWTILFLVFGYSTLALAGDYYINITNSTGYTIDYLYVSPASSDDWQDDVLGDDVLPNGYRGKVTLRGFDSPIFDIQLEDEEGDTYTFYDFNVEKYDLEVKPGDID